MTQRFSATSRNGFTLVEILVVVMIIGLLSTIVGIYTKNHMDQTRKQSTRANIAAICSAISAYELALGKYPPDLNDLVKEGDDKWPGPFLQSTEVPKDAWGNDFKFEIVGKRFRVTSAGPDGKMGTDDDLWNS